MLRLLFGLFLLFAVIFFVIRLAGGSEEAVTPEIAEEKPLVLGEQNNASSSVQLITKGKIVAPEDHREIRITISQDRRSAQVIQGYDGKVIKTMSLPNTPNSYQEFLYAIQAEGFMAEKVEPLVTDRNGVCSTARQYEYKLRFNGATRSSLWSSSCSSRDGTFGGDRVDITKLFERQFPEYRSFAAGINP